MLYALVFEKLGQIFTLFNGNRTYQDRLSLFVTFLYLLDNCVEFALFRLEDNVRVVYSCNRFVGWNFNNVQPVDLPELVLLGKRSTRHTRQLFIKPKVILECDSRNSLGLSCDLDAFLGLDSLVKTVVETPAYHDTSGKLVNDKYLTVLYHVVYILSHGTVGFDSLVDMMQKSHILGIHKVDDIKRLLGFFNTALCKGCGPCLFVYDIISAKSVVIRFVVHLYHLDSLEGLGESVSKRVKLGRLISLS